MGAEHGRSTVIAGAETDGVGGDMRPEMLAAAAGFAVDVAVTASANAGTEELPDVIHHPRIQASHTIGNDYYPMERRVI